MPNTRRQFIRQASLLSGGIGFRLPINSNEEKRNNPEGDRLVLLGTQGGPFIRSYKQTPSANLIVYNNIPFVIDTGYGVTFKLKEAGVNLSTLKYIFITHHHSDHNLELGTLLYNAWVAGLSETVHVFAPVGIKSLLHHYWESNRIDIDTRIKDEGRPDIRTLITSYEVSEGIVLSNPNFEISALKNIHPPVENSFAYKFKLNKKLIVFSGDTTYCAALATFASGADYLVHEIMDGPAVDEMMKKRPKNAAKLKASILSHHTLAEDVGRIAQAANVKNLVLNHFVPPDENMVNEQVWINAVRTNFHGNIIVGQDLLQLSL